MALEFDSTQVQEKQEQIITYRIHTNLVDGDQISLTVKGKSKNFTVPAGQS